MLDTKITETAAAKANAALIKSAYDAFSRGDIQGAMATFAEDIFWHVPGRGPLSRDYRGHAEVLGFFGHFMKLSGGRSWSSPQVHVWTVKDGKARVFREYPGDQQAEDEFWSSHA